MHGTFDISIKPEEYFRLSNGRILKNLYELLNALKSINEIEFNFHVNEDKNDFGNWIRHVFKDEELSHRIYNSKSKEDIMKILMERLFDSVKDEIQDRKIKTKSSFSLNKMTYLKVEDKKGILSHANPEHYFRVANGTVIKGLMDIDFSLESVGEDTFSYHVNDCRNDLSTWIRDVIKDEKLADDLLLAKDKHKTQLIVLRRIVQILSDMDG